MDAKEKCDYYRHAGSDELWEKLQMICFIKLLKNVIIVMENGIHSVVVEIFLNFLEFFWNFRRSFKNFQEFWKNFRRSFQRVSKNFSEFSP